MPFRTLSEWFTAWFAANGFRLFVLVASGVFAFATLRAEVNAKADRADVDDLRAVVKRIDERTASIVLYLCYNQTHSLGCQR